MSFSVEWHPKTREFLRKLPKKISSRIVRRVSSITENPFHFLEHYEGDDFYKLRIGDYRALIDVDHKEKVLFVRVLGHRRNVYKK